jgi:hypothetical protein
MVRLPCGEEHGQHRDQRSEGANFGRAVSDGCGLQETGQRAVEGVNAMAILHQSRYWRIGLCHVLEELAQRARCSGAARLLAVHVIHRGIHPHLKVHVRSQCLSHMQFVQRRCVRRMQSCSRPTRAPASVSLFLRNSFHVPAHWSDEIWYVQLE